MGNLLLYGALLPGNHSELAFITLYPVYMTFHLNTLHVLGSWQLIYGLLWLYKTELDKPFNKYVFQVVASSSMWVYVTHDFFQSAVITYIVIPTGLTYWPAFFITIVINEFCCILSYIGLVKLFSKKKKGRVNQDKNDNKADQEAEIMH